MDAGPPGRAGMSPHHPRSLKVWAAQTAGAARVKPYTKQSEMLSSDPGRVGEEDGLGLMLVPHDVLSLGGR